MATSSRSLCDGSGRNPSQHCPGVVMPDTTDDPSVADDLFPRDVSGLPEVGATAVVPLSDGDVLPLHIGPVRKTIAGTPLRHAGLQRFHPRTGAEGSAKNDRQG